MTKLLQQARSGYHVQAVEYTTSTRILLHRSFQPGWPNPAQGNLRVVLNDTAPCLLRIVDQRGRLSLELQNYRSHEVVDISRLTPGLYIVQVIFSHGDIHTGKVVIR